MGLDWFLSCVAPASIPGKRIFQVMLASSLPPHVNGRSFSSEMPWPVGPRQEGQSPANEVVAASKSAKPQNGSWDRIILSLSSQFRLAFVQNRLGRRGADAGDA